MPDDSELDVIKARGAEAHAAFIRESQELDAAWDAGTLDQWLADNRAKLKGEDGSTSGGSPG